MFNVRNWRRKCVFEYSREIWLFNISPECNRNVSYSTGELSEIQLKIYPEPSNPLANWLPIVRRISTADRSQSIEFHACMSLLTYRVKYVRESASRTSCQTPLEKEQSIDQRQRRRAYYRYSYWQWIDYVLSAQ